MGADLATTQLHEIRDRTRRIETRLTKYLESVGFDTQTQRPYVDDCGHIVIPSLHCSLKDILAVLPDDGNDFVEVVHQGEHVAMIAPPLAKVA